MNCKIHIEANSRTLFRIMLLAVFAVGSAMLMMVLNLHVLPLVKSNQLWVITKVCNVMLFLAVMMILLYLFSARFLSMADRTKKIFLRAILCLNLIGLIPYWILGVPLIYLSYPPVVVFFSHSTELKNIYSKCMEIQEGQTLDQARRIMQQFVINSESPRELVFITPVLSADLCLIQLSDDSPPRVKSVVFELD